MSNGWQIELLPDGEGGARLSFWDHINGKDRLWDIAPNGAVVRSDSDEKVWDEIDLGVDLIDLLTWLEKREADAGRR